MTFPVRRLALVVLLAVPAGLAGQRGARVAGVVRDPGDGLPVRGVRVALAPWLGAWTDSAGRFEVSAPAGRYRPRLDCPRLGLPRLERFLDSLAVTAPGVAVEWSLPDGRTCQPALEAVSYGEFDGIFQGQGEDATITLCDAPWHRVAVALSPERFAELARRVGGESDPRRTALRITVRGRLEGPGFYGRDGRAGYLLEVETLRAARMVLPDAACRR